MCCLLSTTPARDCTLVPVEVPVEGHGGSGYLLMKFYGRGLPNFRTFPSLPFPTLAHRQQLSPLPFPQTSPISPWSSIKANSVQASSTTVSTNGNFITHLAALDQEGTMFIMNWSGVDKASLIFLFRASLFIFLTLTVVSFSFHLALALS